MMEKTITQRITGWINNIYNKIDWKLWLFFRYYFPIYISIHPFKLLKEWRDASNDYIFPNIQFLKYEGHIHKWSLLYIETHPMMWKYKYDYVSFEHEPYIQITIFNRWTYEWRFISPCLDIDNRYPNNHVYWESMLEYLYLYDKDIRKTFENWGWERAIYNADKSEVIGYHNTWTWGMIKNGDVYKDVVYKDYEYIKIVKDEC